MSAFTPNFSHSELAQTEPLADRPVSNACWDDADEFARMQ